MQVTDSALRMGRRLEDGPFVIGQHFQPGLQIGRVIGAGFELGRNPEIGAEEATAEFRDQLFTSPLRPVLGIAAEVTIDA